MSRRNYYCLIAGLPDITHDDKKLHYTLVKLKDYLREELHPEDFGLARLFYYPFDHQNLLNLLFKKNRPWDDRGNLIREQLEELINPKLFETTHKSQFPGYILKFGYLLREKENEETMLEFEEASRYLNSAYYLNLLSSKNDFVRKVGAFRIDTGNIMLALNGRKHGFPFEENLIGEGTVAMAIRKNRTRDFGLSVDFPEIESLNHLYEIENILERELKLDQRFWNFLDEITFFHYFSVERVLAFLLKMFMVERWFRLDYEKGQVMFNSLLKEIESSFEFPEEFTHTYGKKR